MANLYGPRIVTDGLVLHLDAANRKSYPGSGSTWYDLSGNGRDFAMQGTLTHNNFYFDGFNDANYFRGSSYSHRLNPYTYCVWIKYNNNPTDYNTIFENGSWVDTLLYRYQANTASVRVYTESAFRGEHTVAGNALTINSASSTFPISKWYNFVFTRENTTGFPTRMFIDGSLYSSFNMTSVDINISVAYMTLMRSQHTTNQSTDGRLSVFKMYDRTLSADEISRNYNALKGRFGL